MLFYHRFKQPVLCACLTTVLAAWLVSPTLMAESANPHITSPSAEALSQPPSDTVSFATISTSVPEIILSAESVKISVRRLAGGDDIKVSSNCPAHWYVRNNIVRQVALSTTQKGVSLRADATGAQVLANGRIYQLPRDSDGAVRSLKIEDGRVIINGQQLQPLPGSDVPGSCTGPDLLEVQVPDNYSGGLLLSCQGASQVAVDSWQGGSLVASLHGQSTLVTGRLQGLAKAVVDVDGSASAQIKGLSTKAFVANINGSGNVSVDNGSADISNATISGSGTMTLKGKFKNLKKSVNGTGTIQVIE